MTEQTDRLNTALAGREQTFASGAMATATELSALWAAVVIGKPATNEVFSLKARRESTVREDLERMRQTSKRTSVRGGIFCTIRIRMSAQAMAQP